MTRCTLCGGAVNVNGNTGYHRTIPAYPNHFVHRWADMGTVRAWLLQRRWPILRRVLTHRIKARIRRMGA